MGNRHHQQHQHHHRNHHHHYASITTPTYPPTFMTISDESKASMCPRLEVDGIVDTADLTELREDRFQLLFTSIAYHSRTQNYKDT